MRNYLRDWRETRGLTLEQVARQMGTTKPTVSRLERSQRKLTTVWLDKFAQIYHLPPEELFHSPFGNRRKIEILETTGTVAVTSRDNEETWILPAQWVQHDIHAAPSDIEIYTVVSDTMVPTLQMGDRVVINVRLRHPNPAGIFMLDEADISTLMRLQIVNPKGNIVRVSADNAHYVAYERKLSELKIRGRVVARVHRM